MPPAPPPPPLSLTISHNLARASPASIAKPPRDPSPPLNPPPIHTLTTQALAAPTRWAIGLSPTSPRHYDFGDFGSQRRESIERIYAALNQAGEGLGEGQCEEVAAEANLAFRHNSDVYSEEGSLWSAAARGVANVGVGYARSRIGGKAE